MDVTFSLVLWSIAQSAFAPVSDVSLSSLPAVHVAAAHLVYGAALDWLAGRARAA